MSLNKKANVHQGTLALMILKTLETLGSLHAYGIARRIEQTSGDTLEVPYGTIYPALLKLEQRASLHPLGMLPPIIAEQSITG